MPRTNAPAGVNKYTNESMTIVVSRWCRAVAADASVPAPALYDKYVHSASLTFDISATINARCLCKWCWSRFFEFFIWLESPDSHPGPGIRNLCFPASIKSTNNYAQNPNYFEMHIRFFYDLNSSSHLLRVRVRQTGLSYLMWSIDRTRINVVFVAAQLTS